MIKLFILILLGLSTVTAEVRQWDVFCTDNAGVSSKGTWTAADNKILVEEKRSDGETDTVLIGKEGSLKLESDGVCRGGWRHTVYLNSSYWKWSYGNIQGECHYSNEHVIIPTPSQVSSLRLLPCTEFVYHLQPSSRTWWAAMLGIFLFVNIGHFATHYTSNVASYKHVLQVIDSYDIASSCVLVFIFLRQIEIAILFFLEGCPSLPGAYFLFSGVGGLFTYVLFSRVLPSSEDSLPYQVYVWAVIAVWYAISSPLYWVFRAPGTCGDLLSQGTETIIVLYCMIGMVFLIYPCFLVFMLCYSSKHPPVIH